MSLDFDRLIEALQESLQHPLPGSAAHEPMRATAIGDVKPNFEHNVPPKPGSVLILLYPDEGQIKFPLTKRPEYLGAHSGQVSFPGGKAEPGESAVQTALREGEEEIGIRSSSIQIIGRLSDFYVIPSNFLVTPVIGFLHIKPYFTPDPVEVVKILEGTIEDLVREDAIAVKDITAAKVFRLRAPHFVIENEIVWGATAMMLNELREIIRNTG